MPVYYVEIPVLSTEFSKYRAALIMASHKKNALLALQKHEKFQVFLNAEEA